MAYCDLCREEKATTTVRCRCKSPVTEAPACQTCADEWAKAIAEGAVSCRECGDGDNGTDWLDEECARG